MVARYRWMVAGLAVAGALFIGLAVQVKVARGEPWWPSVVMPLAVGALAALPLWSRWRQQHAGTAEPTSGLMTRASVAIVTGLALAGLVMWLLG